MYICQRP